MLFELRKTTIRVVALVLAPVALASAQAPDAGNGNIRIFEPTYFIEFDPLTALDMVDRLPGVSAQESDGGRGLSGVR
ncbi:MAG: TonB-dependent receptor, partial [Gammaproteobacteria bacterium]|nr:TonB-dependent receptor [Gammaproteobacteria bacterium]